MEPPTHIWDAPQTVDLVEYIQKQSVLAKAFLDPSSTPLIDRCLFQKKLCLQLLQRTEWMEWMRKEKWVILGEKGLRPTEKWGKGNPVDERLAWLQMQHIRLCSRLQNYDSPAAMGKGTPERKIWEEYKKKGQYDWYFAYHKLWMKYSPGSLKAQASIPHPSSKSSLRSRIGNKEVEEDKKSEEEEDDDDIEFVEPVVKGVEVEKVGSNGGNGREPSAGETSVGVSMAKIPAGKDGGIIKAASAGRAVSTTTLATATTTVQGSASSRHSSMSASTRISATPPEAPNPARQSPSGPSGPSAIVEKPIGKRPLASRLTPAGPSRLSSTTPRPPTPPISNLTPPPTVSSTSLGKRPASPDKSMRPPPSAQPTPKRTRRSSPPMSSPISGPNDAGNPIVIDSDEDDEDGDEEDNTPLTRHTHKRRSSPPLTRRKLHHHAPSSPDRMPTPPPLLTDLGPPTPPLPSPSRSRGRRQIDFPHQASRGIPTPEPSPGIITPSSDSGDINQVLNPRGHAKEIERLRRLETIKSTSTRSNPVPRPRSESPESDGDSNSSIDEDSPIPENQYEGLILETGSTMLSFEHRPSLGIMGPRLSFRDDGDDDGDQVGHLGPGTPPLLLEDTELGNPGEEDIEMAEAELGGDDGFVRTRPSTPALPLSPRPPTPPLYHLSEEPTFPTRLSSRSESPTLPEVPDGFLEEPMLDKPGYDHYVPSEIERYSPTLPPDYLEADMEVEEDDDFLNLSEILGDEDDFLSALGGVVGLTT